MTKSFAALTIVLILPACEGTGMVSSSSARGVTAPAAPASNPLKGGQTVLWSFSTNLSGYPQIQFAGVPLRKNSKVTTIYSNSKNKLAGASGMHVDNESRLWILTVGKSGGSPGSVNVFELPLTKESPPQYTFVLEGTADPYHLAFDASGNLWVLSNPYANSVIEYTGPFNQSGTLYPALTLTKGLDLPSGLAFDKNGNLYVANSLSDVKHSIAVFAAPVSNKQPYFLNGLRRPGGLIFDNAGNLYASDNYTSLSAVVRYNGNNLKAGAHPDIVDRTGLRLKETYEADFAFTGSGDLYFSNCGKNGSVYRYPTSTKTFSAQLAPAVNYANGKTGECVWGIAIQ